MAALCSILYGTTVVTQLAVTSTTQTSVITGAPVVSSSTSTSLSTICSACPTGIIDPIGAPCTPTCSTSTSLLPLAVTLPGAASTITSVVSRTITNVITSSSSTGTTCRATTTTAAPTRTSQAVVVTPAPPPTTRVQVLSGNDIVTSYSTQLIVSTFYDGQVVSSSSVVPVLVQAQDTLMTSNVGSGAIAGAVVGGCVAVLIAALFILGCARRRGPLKFLGGRSYDDQEDFTDIWSPTRHRFDADGEDADVLPNEKDGEMSERSNSMSHRSVVPHRSVSRPQSMQSIATTDFGRTLSLRSSSSGHSPEWSPTHEAPPLPYPRAYQANSLDQFGPGYPVIARRTSAPLLSHAPPRPARLSRHKSTSAGQLFTSIAELPEDDETIVTHRASLRDASDYTSAASTLESDRPAAKRASTMPDLWAAAPTITVSSED